MSENFFGGEGAGQFGADGFAAEDDDVLVCCGALDAACEVGRGGCCGMRGGLAQARECDGEEAESDYSSCGGWIHRDSPCWIDDRRLGVTLASIISWDEGAAVLDDR